LTKARTNADNVAGDISGVTAGTGLTGGGTSGTVTLTNDMATTIAAKGDILVGTADNAYTNLSVATTNGYVLQSSSSTTSGLSWAAVEALPSQTGNSGKYLTTNGTTASWGTVAYNWTQRKPGDGSIITKIAYNGSNLYVAVQGNGGLWTSPDGYTWTSRTSGFGSTYINDVTYGNGIWVAVGNNGTLTTSTDGITWTARTSNMGANNINAIAYANSLFVAVGEGGGTTNTGGLIYSSDGITWTRKSQSITVGPNYQDVCWNGTNWFIGSSVSTNNYLYASTPSGTWTAGARGSNTIYFSESDGTRTFILTNNEFQFTSSSTFASWSTVNSVGSPSSSKIYVGYYNNKIYWMSTSSLVEFSTEQVQAASTAWYPSSYKITLNPTAQGTYASTSFAADMGNILVTSSGILLSSDSGKILTSF
jgi:hypothetical protein